MTEQPQTHTAVDDATGQAFLAHVRDAWRGPAMNLFLEPIRVGLATTPETVVQAVVRLAQRKCRGREPWYAPCDDLTRLLQALDAYPDDALRLAAWALAYEALPSAVKLARKQQRTEAYQHRAMAGKDATDKQRALLLRLGYEGPIESRLHASRLIEERLPARRHP